MEGKIVNRVANSPLVTIDLEEYYHHGDRVEYDIAQNLFQGLILREKTLGLLSSSMTGPNTVERM